MLVYALFVSVSFPALALAQSLSLSSACTDTLTNLLSSPDAACLNPSSLLSITVDPDQSVPNTINNWLTGVCSTGSCSDEALAAVVTNITTGCSQDLATFGVTPDIADSIIPIVQAAYPTVRTVVCLKDDSADELCVTQTLNNLESVIGKLGLDDLSFFNLISDAQKLLAAGVDNLACTACVKEAFTVASQDFPDLVPQVNSEAEALCGANFIDGTSPDGISETQVDGVFSADSTGSNGAAVGIHRSLGGMTIIGLTFILLI